MDQLMKTAPRAPGREIVNKADERLFIPRAETEALEQDILRRRHIERYAVARQFVHGVTVDTACGCGYGTYILSKNPDVTRAYGIDMLTDTTVPRGRTRSVNRTALPPRTGAQCSEITPCTGATGQCRLGTRVLDEDR